MTIGLPSRDFRGLTLLPGRAVWQRDARALWIADLHLGKAAAFRRFGQPAPAGTTQENLTRLDRLIDLCEPRRLIVLGDFFHARESCAPPLIDALAAWRAARRSLDCVVVRGNHDAPIPVAAWPVDFDCVDEPYALDGVEGRHHPLDAPDDAGPPALAGHVHPVVRLKGPGRDSVRLPCFAIEGRQVLLPAFGAFTGGHLITGARKRELWATTGEALYRAPPV
jgi:DNA ligase-associated metallophosphoesterase